MSIPQSLLEQSIQINIQQALQEDIGDGDITAMLTPEDEQATATIISREHMVLAGQPWVNALISAYDNTVQVTWLKQEGCGYKNCLVCSASWRFKYKASRYTSDFSGLTYCTKIRRNRRRRTKSPPRFI